jgi:hypothetical protein
LPFGLAPAPRVFTKILKVVMAALHRGHRVIIYLDDILFLNEKKGGTGGGCQDGVGSPSKTGFSH